MFPLVQSDVRLASGWDPAKGDLSSEHSEMYLCSWQLLSRMVKFFLERFHRPVGRRGRIQTRIGLARRPMLTSHHAAFRMPAGLPMVLDFFN